MAITSSGIGSGLDVDSIVTQLVAAERAPVATRLTRLQARANYQLSALGSFKSVMANLQSAAAKLTVAGGQLSQRSATTTNASFVAVSAGTTAQPGNYEVEVKNLAKAHKIASASFSDADQLVGAGSMTLKVGSESFSITLDADDKLSDLRNAINNASDNTGVTASLIKEDGGTRLVLSSQETGTANALTITTGLTTFSDTQPPIDAVIEVDGYTVTRSSNHVTDAIDGVTIDLLKAEEGTKFEVAVAINNGAASSAINSFVNAYNSMTNIIAAQTRYDPVAKTAGALIGDAAVRGASQSLRNIISSQLSDTGTYGSLLQLGITSKTDGTLQLDADKLQTALTTDPGSIRKLFGSSNGLAVQIGKLTDAYLGTDGQIATKVDNLNSQVQSVTDQTAQLDARMVAVEKRYRAQFSGLDAIVSKYQNTQGYLTQLFAQKRSDD